MKVGWIMALLMIGGAFAQDDTKKEIDELKQRNAENERRIQDLEKKQGAAPAQPQPESKWTDIQVGPTKLKFYGFIRLDVIRDDSRADFPGQGTTTGLFGFVRSEDVLAPRATIGAKNDDPNLFISPRLTRLGIDLDGPSIDLLWGAKVTGKFEVDFYNGGSESRNIIRDRHFYLKLTWGDFSMLAGQTADVISPLWPIVNADNVMWGMGNLGDRRPQIRWEFAPQLGDGKLIFQFAVGLTGAVDAQALSVFAGSGKTNGEASGEPTTQARLAYRTPFMFEKQFLEIGIWAHHAMERTDVRINGYKEFESWAAGSDMTIPLYEDIVWFKAEIWTGADLGDVRGGIFQDLNNKGQEIRSHGGWGEIGVRPIKWLVFYVGYSVDDPANQDLTPVGVGGGNSAQRAENETYYFAIRFLPDPVEIGLDYLNVTTRYSSLGHGDDNRVGIYFAYKF